VHDEQATFRPPRRSPCAPSRNRCAARFSAGTRTRRFASKPRGLAADLRLTHVDAIVTLNVALMAHVAPSPCS